LSAAAFTCAVLLAAAADTKPSFADQLRWASGFERGFPGGEWLEEYRPSYSPDGRTPEGRSSSSAWTIIERVSTAPVLSGEHAYKGWIDGPSLENHRAYPVLHTDLSTPVVNTFHVYLDVDYDSLSDVDWIQFGTWGNYDPLTRHGEWALHTMAVRNRKLEFAHTNPFHGQYVGPAPQPDFPLRKWVRFTVYLLYAGKSGFVKVWQDSVPMLQAEVSALRKSPGKRLRTAHWGLYASPDVKKAVQYNDDISLCTLEHPLGDLAHEPMCRPPIDSSVR
jgi:hypothetical protein